MVDPKKDYELLMRYLQGGALKQEPASVPDQSFDTDWKQVPKSSSSLPYTYNKKRPRAAETLRPVRFLKKRGFSNVSFSRKSRIAIAGIASVAFLFLLGKGYAFYKLTPESLYTKLYVPFVAADAANMQQVPKNSIEYYYTIGNYVAATLQSKKQEQLSDKDQLLTGISYLQRDDYSVAIKWLETVANNFKNPYHHQAEYYLSLAYLKNEDYDRCIEKMQHIAYLPSHPYNKLISPETIRDLKMLKWK